MQFSKIVAMGMCMVLFNGCQQAQQLELPEVSTSLSAVSPTQTTSNASSLQSVDQSKFRWETTIYSYEVRESLTTIGSTILYDGSTQPLSHNDTPEIGNTFLLLKLNIEKTQPGKSSFDWMDVSVVDANGNEYFRHENDSFLSNHNYERIAATSLKMGATTGWVCFEIDKTAAQGALYFVHKADEGENKIQIK